MRWCNPGAFAAVVLAASAASAWADACQCRSDPMSTNRSYVHQSGPPGICAVAQDRGFCAQAQIQWPVRASDPGRFDHGGPAEALRRIGAHLRADAAMDLAAKTPPERW